VEYGAGWDDDRAITPLCLSVTALECEVARLKKNLDDILVEARSEYGSRPGRG
jgi:hypothetical protein